MGNPGCLLFISTQANWLVHGLGKEQNGAIALNIRTPPVEDLPFFLIPKDWLKLHSPLKPSIKYGLTSEENGFTLKNFEKIKASTPKNSIFLYSTSKEILIYNLPLENSMVHNRGRGGADIKCNSPFIPESCLLFVQVSSIHHKKGAKTLYVLISKMSLKK